MGSAGMLLKLVKNALTNFLKFNMLCIIDFCPFSLFNIF